MISQSAKLKNLMLSLSRSKANRSCAVHKLGGHLLHRIWLLARRDEGAYPQRSVTEEQQSQKPNAVQPSGRHVFSAQASLFAPYRPMNGPLVTHASYEPTVPGARCPLNLGTAP